MRLRSKEEWELWYLKANPWNTEGTEKDRVRSQIVLERLKYARFAKLLDLGCGEGGLTNILSTISEYTLGVDIAENALSRARKRYPHIEFRQGELLDVIALPEIAGTPFDFISVSEVLYYFQTDEEREAAFGGLARLGSPSCVFYVSALVTGNSKYRRYFTHGEFLDKMSQYFNVIDVFPSVVDLGRPLKLMRNLLPSERMRLSALKAWTLSRTPEQCSHLGCLAVKKTNFASRAPTSQPPVLS